jgi:predicted MFS family arabinose efflux permease
MPLTLVFNHHFFALLAAASCAVIGSSILGVAQALLARKLLPPSTRRVFFHSIELLLTLPFLILVPIGAFVAWYWSFATLFMVMAIALVAVVVPLYFTLVLKTHRKRL